MKGPVVHQAPSSRLRITRVGWVGGYPVLQHPQTAEVYNPRSHRAGGGAITTDEYGQSAVCECPTSPSASAEACLRYVDGEDLA
jgi:hypothetical protein